MLVYLTWNIVIYENNTAQKCFPLQISSVNPQFPADLVTFTEEIRNGKLHILCSVMIPAHMSIETDLL